MRQQIKLTEAALVQAMKLNQSMRDLADEFEINSRHRLVMETKELLEELAITHLKIKDFLDRSYKNVYN